jgi:hypothetical protein
MTSATWSTLRHQWDDNAMNLEEIGWGRVAYVGFIWFMLGTSGGLL